MTAPPANLVASPSLLALEDRERFLGQRGCVVWMTGLSGSGKSTIARVLEKRLHEAYKVAIVLDGDLVRSGLNADLGFTREERTENIRRAGELAGQDQLHVLLCHLDILARERPADQPDERPDDGRGSRLRVRSRPGRSIRPVSCVR